MAPNSSIISINGKHYDARSGKLLGGMTHHKSKKTAGAVMDGVIRRPQSVHPKAQPRAYKQGTLEKPRSVQKAKPAKDVHNTASKTKTLFRGSVKKPQTNARITTTAHQSAGYEVKNPHTGYSGLTPKVDEERLKRAEKAPKSSFISKFSSGLGAHATNNLSQKEVALSGEVIMPGAPSPAPNQASAQKTLVKAKKPDIDDLVDHALATATAHKQRSPKKRMKMPKLASAMAILLVIFLLGGFFAYQYVPNFAMRVASQRSGVNASLPTYEASGFSFGSIDVSPGTVEVNYIANADKNRSYSVMQKNSNWDSQSLYSNFVLMEDKNPQSSQNNGKTVYLYDGGNATWVSGGVWYVIDSGSAELTSDQLVKIASSI